MLTILWFITVAFLITVAIAVGLILSEWPRPFKGSGGLSFRDLLGRVRVDMPMPDPVPMRDGYELLVRDYGATQGPLIIFVHGSGWNGMQFDQLASGLSDQGRVLVPDLRGHGANPGLRGDIPHIGQLEEDLCDLIAANREDGQKVVVIGHSSGGGLVVRFAGGKYGAQMDAAVLLAPFLKHDAPTTRDNSGGWAQPLTRRLIGLSMLNALRIQGLNRLKVITFNFPPEVLEGPYGDLATTAYSYRLNTSYAPRSKYLADVAALPPFLLIAGREDEAFVADGYAPLMSGATGKGSYLVVPDQSHLGIVDAPQTEAAIREFLNGV